MGAQGYIGRAPGDSSVIVARQTFTPTGITTNFTFASGYTVGYVDAYLNGARLIEGDDYTATDGSVVGLTTHAQNGDVLELVVYKAFNVANVTAATDDFSVGGDLSVTGTSALTGNATVGSAITMYASAGIVSATQFYADGVLINPGAGGTWANYDTNTGVSTTKKVKIENNLEVTGAASTFSGNLNVGGVLTYDDVTNVDAVGYATFRSGINVQGAGSTTTTLNVTGFSTFSDNVSIGDSIFHTGDTNTAIRFPAADTFAVETSGSEVFRVDSNQRLMVGQTSPYTATGAGSTIATFTDSGNYRTNLVVSNQTNGTDSGSAVVLAAHGNDWIIEAKGLAKGQRSLAINSGSTEALRITSGGLVGIGTTNPAGTLEIDAASTTDMIMLDVAGTNFARLGHNSASGTNILDVRSEGHMRFLTNGNNERFRINSAGRVGIATVLPEAQLTVKGDGDIGAKDFKYTYSNTHGIQVKGGEPAIDIVGTDSGNHGASLLLRTSIDGFGMHFDPARDQLRFKYTVPSADDFNIHDGTNTSTNTEVLTIGKTGICTATQFDATSDVSLKENIEVIDEPIIKLSELKGVTFDWKAGGHSVGVIAQDVEKVLPTAVGGSDDRKTVNYNAIIGLLVESVKDQQKQIEELKSFLDK